MVTMFVRHKVENYDAWRKVYDDFDQTRRGLGVKGAAVYQEANDEKDVTVTHQFEDLDSATSFANSEDLRAAMGKAGVAGPPDIWFTKEA